MRRTRVLWAGAGLVAVAAVAVGAALYTDRSPFCRSCHEMVPYYDAWTASAHEDAACIDCHVDPGLPARFAHKFVALKELWVHVTSEPRFPIHGTEVPDARCRRCHEEPGPEEPPAGFSHDEHAGAAACQGCHAPAGHEMTFEALDDAGVLRSAAASANATYYEPLIERADAAPAAIEGHAPVSCSGCHDMSSAGCDECHEPPKEHYTLVTCERCHEPSRPFEQGDFKHSPTLDCSRCHEPPEEDHFTGTACRDCHTPDAPFDEAEEPGED